MKLILNRIFGCTLGLLVGSFLFNFPLTLREIILSVLIMTLFYVFLRPLVNLVILPFNMLSVGIIGLLTDALYVLWATRDFGYLQSLLIAVVIAVCYWPYKKYKSVV